MKKGDRLPTNTNGVIDEKTVEEGKRVTLDGNTLKVTVPSKSRKPKGSSTGTPSSTRGSKRYRGEGSGAVGFILALGFALGLMAEGFTDMCGYKLEKIKHYEGVH